MGATSTGRFETLTRGVLGRFPLRRCNPISIILRRRADSLSSVNAICERLVSALVAHPFGERRDVLSYPRRGAKRLPEGDRARVIKGSTPTRVRARLCRQKYGGSYICKGWVFLVEGECMGFYYQVGSCTTIRCVFMLAMLPYEGVVCVVFSFFTWRMERRSCYLL